MLEKCCSVGDLIWLIFPSLRISCTYILKSEMCIGLIWCESEWNASVSSRHLFPNLGISPKPWFHKFTFQPVQHSPVQTSAGFGVEWLHLLSKARGIRNRKLTKEWRGNNGSNWNKIVGDTFLTVSSGRQGQCIVHPYILTYSEKQHQDNTTQTLFFVCLLFFSIN